MDVALAALGSFLDPTMLLFLGIGVVAGVVIGVIPGLGGTAAVAMVLPFVFILDQNQAMALIIGAVAVVHTSDAISSILMGMPGSAAASVLLLDGHEMAKKGEASRALSNSFLSSMIGGLIGVIGLTIVIPLARPIVLLFGSPEIFMLTILGISLTALLSKGNMLKGLTAGAFGVLLGQVGAAPTTPENRFTFGNAWMIDGFDLVAVALGIFGIAEVIALVARKTSVSTVTTLGSGWFQGIKDVARNWLHVVRGSLIGIWAGILPGVGATAGTWMAYGQAKATVRGEDRKSFGKGDPRGVIAPSSASNSVEAGGLIPTLLFGVPGGAPFALLLGALLIFGVEPGPRIITDHLDTIYVIIWSLAIASVLGSLLCLLISKPLAKLAFVRFPLLAAALVPVLFIAGFQGSRLLEMLPVMLILGVAGWLMKIFGFDRAPFLIGFVLSLPLERYYYLTANLYSFDQWFFRPIVLILVGVLLLPVVFAVIRMVRGKNKPAAEEVQEEQEPVSPKWAIGLSAGFLVIFVAAFIMAQSFQPTARLLPSIITVIGAVFALCALVIDISRLKKKGALAGEDAAQWRVLLREVTKSFVWLVVFVALVYVFGLIVAVAIFVPIFLWRVAQPRWWTIVAYPVVLVVLFLVAERFAGIYMPNGYIYLGI